MNTKHLTQSQELIWLGEELYPGSPMNNMAFVFSTNGPIDATRFSLAFSRLITACDALRMVFREKNGEVYPVVLPDLPYEIPVDRPVLMGDPEVAVELAHQNFAARKLDVSERCFDALLLLIGEDDVYFFFRQHHLTTDGWGMANQLQWLWASYAGKDPAPLPSFADYVARAAVERQSVTVENARTALAEKARKYPAPPELFGRTNPTRDPRSSRNVVALSAEKTAALKALAQSPDFRAWTVDLALFNIFLTALYAYVYRISGQEDLVIGAPAHNRLSADDRATAGLYMELFPVHAAVSAEDTFLDLHEKVREASLEFLRYARPGNSSVTTGRSFNVLLNFVNVTLTDPADSAMGSEWLHPGETEPGHHLKLQVYDFEDSGSLQLCFDTNDAVISADFHQAVSEGFLGVLDQLLADVNTSVAQLSPAEERQLLGFQAMDASYPKDKTIVDLFTEQVAKNPAAPAVHFRDLTLSYADLDRQAEAFAAELRTHGIGPEDIVPVCLERSEKMLVALLGVLKAGAAYLPVDPEFPEERKAFLGADAGAKIWIDEQGIFLSSGSSPMEKGEVAGKNRSAIFSSPLSSGERAGERSRAQRASPSGSQSNIAYLLYTSGSTGRPKGVMNQHDGLLNRLWWMQKAFQLDPAVDVVLQKTTFTFDVSGWEFWWPLITGCPVVFAEPGGHKDVDYLQKTIRDYGVTTLHFVPPMLELFLLKKTELPSLKRVICSGEALTPSQVNTFRTQYPGVALHNLYGPTEAAIDVTHWPVPSLGEHPEEITRVPIGKPIDNVPIRILGPEGQDRPIGVPGELYLGGVQVARGYLNRPELTAEKFVTLPLVNSQSELTSPLSFREGPGERARAQRAAPQRWYRTGDLAHWLPDGNIVFLGRMDSQVKLRGYRIELGEIEHALLEADSVQQAVVLVKKDLAGTEHLTAYLVSEEAINPTKLSYALGQKLPGYMVPTFFVQLEEIPTTTNGKIDRKRLPDPVFIGDSGSVTEEELSDFEQMIHAAWTEVFALDRIGRHVNFLDLGGHSLTGIRLVNRINEAFELELAANTIFRYPTIAALATHVEDTIRQLLEEMDAD